ncbi:MAG: ABC transporter permease [Clostridia bacterium]|nr:ABC transporter permease [Clostridia bacterium]
MKNIGVKYFFLETKRFLLALPFVLMLSLALFICIFIAFSAMLENEEESDQKYEIAIVGDVSDTYLKLGMAALQNFDSSRFAMNLSFLSEEAAKEKLADGEISAYILIPEGFIVDAYKGDVGKLTYVTKTSPTGTIDYVKDELLSVISTLLVESQKGVYASGDIGKELAGLKYGSVTNDAAFKYVDLILSRSKMYKTEILGVSDGLGLITSVMCGLMLFFISLIAIGFAPVFVRRDISLSKILSASRFGAVGQVIGEYVAFVLSSFCVIFLLFAPLFIFFGEKLSSLVGVSFTAEFFTGLIISFLLITSMQFFVYQISDGICAGVLAQFLCAVSLSYFSGCFYPIYFFPEFIQKLSVFLPLGAARLLLARIVTNGEITIPLVTIMFYFSLFIVLSIVIRHRDIVKAKGDAI